MKNLIQNAIYLPDVDVYLCSTFRHDFKEYIYPDGSSIYVDGGIEYQRMGIEGNIGCINYEDYCLYDDSPFELIVEKKLWGVYDKKNNVLNYRPLRTLDNQHLKAILIECPYAPLIVTKVIDHLLSQK